MKKYILFILCLIGTIAYGQNTFKYELRANGGLRVGGSTFAEIDSITLQAGKLRIMTGATLQKIAGHVLYTDTATMLTKYARKASPTFSGIAKLNTDTLATQAYARTNGGSGTPIDTTSLSSRIDLKLNVLDTADMLSPYALLSEVGEGGSMTYPGAGIPLSTGSAWGTSITNNSTEWNKAGVVGNGTAPPYFDGSSDGGQILTFYGDNGFWTALQGGAPTANRSYRLPIAALPSAGTTSLMNIDEYGNMGFAFNGLPSTLTATELGYSDGVTSSIQNQLNAKVNASDTAAMLAHYALLSEIGTGGDISILKTRVDSIVDVLKDSVNVETLLNVNLSTDTLSTKAYARSVGGGGGSAGITLNSGTLTLTGDAGTADDITFYTNGDGQYNLPAGGGNLTIMSQVQGWISDTADVIRDMIMDSILLRIEPIFVFGAGGGMPTDTATFQNGVIAGAFYNSGSDTLKITSIRGVLAEGTGTETIGVQVSWHATFKSASAVNLNSSAYTITSITTGNEDTSFANDEIPPGVWVWCTLSGASANNKPTLLSLTMSGYKIPTY